MGDPERRHETPWACDGLESGTGRSFVVCFWLLRRRVRLERRRKRSRCSDQLDTSRKAPRKKLN